MSKDPLEFLRHIADECLYLLSVQKDLSKDDFLADETLKRAVTKFGNYRRSKQKNTRRCLD